MRRTNGENTSIEKLNILLLSFIHLLLIYKMQIKSGIVWIVLMKDH